MRQNQTLPLTLTRRRIYILPSAYGFFFIVVLVAMLAGSINYNNNLGFLLVFLLGSINLIVMFHTYRNLSGLKILSVSCPPVFAGDMAVFRILLRTPGWSRSALAFSFKNNPTTLENLEQNFTHEVEVKAKTQTRGVFKPGVLRIWSRFPLGLFHAWATCEPEMSCIVYPAPKTGKFQHGDAFEGDGSDEKQKHQGADDFMGFKPYQPGDPIRHISWKSLSKGLGVFLKDFHGESSRTVVFDFKEIIAGDTETKLSLLCYLILNAHRMNLDYGLKLPGQTIAPDKGPAHRHKCLKALGLFGFDGGRT